MSIKLFIKYKYLLSSLFSLLQFNRGNKSTRCKGSCLPFYLFPVWEQRALARNDRWSEYSQVKERPHCEIMEMLTNLAWQPRPWSWISQSLCVWIGVSRWCLHLINWNGYGVSQKIFGRLKEDCPLCLYQEMIFFLHWSLDQSKMIH